MLIEIVCFPQSTLGLSACADNNSNLTPGLPAYFSIFAMVFMCPNLFLELRDNGVLKNLHFCL